MLMAMKITNKLSQLSVNKVTEAHSHFWQLVSCATIKLHITISVFSPSNTKEDYFIDPVKNLLAGYKSAFGYKKNTK